MTTSTPPAFQSTSHNCRDAKHHQPYHYMKSKIYIFGILSDSDLHMFKLFTLLFLVSYMFHSSALFLS